MGSRVRTSPGSPNLDLNNRGTDLVLPYDIRSSDNAATTSDDSFLFMYMQVVLDGIEGAPYKRVHIVRLNEPVPKNLKKFLKTVDFIHNILYNNIQRDRQQINMPVWRNRQTPRT